MSKMIRRNDTMHDLHVDDFYKDTGRILLQLYGSFPRPTPIYVDDICGPDEVDEYGLHSPRHLACLGTMLWLADEGYLRFENTIRQEAIDQAVLTHKSFILLNAQHEFVAAGEHEQPARAPRQTNAFCLHEAVMSGSSAWVRQVVHYLLARGV